MQEETEFRFGSPPVVSSVAEVPGEYGPVAVPEILIQKIWWRGDFRKEGLQTLDGQPVRIVHPGRWNRQGGPDFLEAELEIGERRRIGDVELHFYRGDWEAHGHDQNPSFVGVVLHVVVFDPRGQGRPVRRIDGVEPAECILAPLLPLDLEAYAQADALRQLEGRDVLELAAPLLELSLEERRARLREEARSRWNEKVARMRARIREVGWTAALHNEALMTLGYSKNRRGMHAVALRFPLESWARDRAVAESAWTAEGVSWTTAGVRPANHPRVRLDQYARWVQSCPDWPGRLREWVWEVEDPRWEETTGMFRRRSRMRDFRLKTSATLAGDTIKGTRWDTLIADVFLPALGATREEALWGALWYHATAGDLPDAAKEFLRVTGLHRKTTVWPLSNGSFQGCFRWIVAQSTPPDTA